MSDLSDDEKKRVVAQVDYFIDLVSKRYEVKPDEVLEAVRWVRERKQFADKIKSTGMVSLIGLIFAALATAIWEGVKAAIAKGGQ